MCDPSGVASFFRLSGGIVAPLTRNSSTPGYSLATLRVELESLESEKPIRSENAKLLIILKVFKSSTNGVGWL